MGLGGQPTLSQSDCEPTTGAGASESPVEMTSQSESPEAAGLGHSCSLASSCGFFFFFFFNVLLGKVVCAERG